MSALDDLQFLVKQETGVTNSVARNTVKAVLNHIQTKVKAGEGVELIGFGSFKTVDKAERVGRNPKTGEAITIPAQKVVKFKASKNFLAE